MLCVETSPEGTRRWCAAQRSEGRRLGFVPTMGALHEGHLHLVDALRDGGVERIAVSIFVNPTQFGPTEDFAKYPRVLEADCAKLAARGVDLVFAPDQSTMVRSEERTAVRVTGLTDHLCGPLRPGHFEGVATVVTKLLSIIGPCDAAFGRKDYQQFKVIERLVTDLFLPVRVHGVPTMREADGLAMSSRNAYLSAADRGRAAAVPNALRAALEAHARGERDASVLRSALRSALSNVDRIEYAEVCDADTLVPILMPDKVAQRALFVLAVRVGNTRLIDNVVSTEDGLLRKM
jgi:pantoate--beta-alanine ligase